MKGIIISILAMLLIVVSLSSAQSYIQSGGTVTKTDQVYTASASDQSGVLVTNSGILTLMNSTVKTSGNTTSNDSSSFYGLNAGVLATSASTITLMGCKITTTGTGANGVFATGSGTSITLLNDTITCANDGAHGVDATMVGTLTLTDVIISSAGAHGAAISTDRGGGTITVKGGTATASGQDSPGIYCTGTIVVSDATVSGTGSEGAVIEGANSITLTNTVLTGAKGSRDRGILIYQSMSGDATGTKGVFTMIGGSFTWPSTSGPAIYVTNSTGVITLKGVTFNNSSATLVKASADQWGTSGSNGGTVALTANDQTLTGNIVIDKLSSVTATLKNSSTLTGAINTANTAKSVALTLDSTSSWTVTATSYLTSLSDTNGVSGESITNITGIGHNIYYDNSLAVNGYLGSKTYSLVNGGELIPKTTNAVDCPQASPLTAWMLGQNYPNPSNPTTTIQYELPARSTVRLVIYNVLGQVVKELINTEQHAGHQSAVWNANVSSGLYFYRLEATSKDDPSKRFVETKKMLLLKFKQTIIHIAPDIHHLGLFCVCRAVSSTRRLKSSHHRMQAG